MRLLRTGLRFRGGLGGLCAQTLRFPTRPFFVCDALCLRARLLLRRARFVCDPLRLGARLLLRGPLGLAADALLCGGFGLGFLLGGARFIGDALCLGAGLVPCRPFLVRNPLRFDPRRLAGGLFGFAPQALLLRGFGAAFCFPFLGFAPLPGMRFRRGFLFGAPTIFFRLHLRANPLGFRLCGGAPAVRILARQLPLALGFYALAFVLGPRQGLGGVRFGFRNRFAMIFFGFGRGPQPFRLGFLSGAHAISFRLGHGLGFRFGRAPCCFFAGALLGLRFFDSTQAICLGFCGDPRFGFRRAPRGLFAGALLRGGAVFGGLYLCCCFGFRLAPLGVGLFFRPPAIRFGFLRDLAAICLRLLCGPTTLGLGFFLRALAFGLRFRRRPLLFLFRLLGRRCPCCCLARLFRTAFFFGLLFGAAPVFCGTIGGGLALCFRLRGGDAALFFRALRGKARLLCVAPFALLCRRCTHGAIFLFPGHARGQAVVIALWRDHHHIERKRAQRRGDHAGGDNRAQGPRRLGQVFALNQRDERARGVRSGEHHAVETARRHLRPQVLRHRVDARQRIQRQIAHRETDIGQIGDHARRRTGGTRMDQRAIARLHLRLHELCEPLHILRGFDALEAGAAQGRGGQFTVREGREGAHTDARRQRAGGGRRHHQEALGVDQVHGRVGNRRQRHQRRTRHLMALCA